jgi:hypothetical protein
MREQTMVARPLKSPAMWELFCFRFLEMSKPLSRRLWSALQPSESQPLLYAIARAEGAWMRPELVQRFGDLANPALMMELCSRVAPECGQPRERAVVELEQKILARTSRDGGWL